MLFLFKLEENKSLKIIILKPIKTNIKNIRKKRNNFVLWFSFVFLLLLYSKLFSYIERFNLKKLLFFIPWIIPEFIVLFKIVVSFCSINNDAFWIVKLSSISYLVFSLNHIF